MADARLMRPRVALEGVYYIKYSMAAAGVFPVLSVAVKVEAEADPVNTCIDSPFIAETSSVISGGLYQTARSVI